MCSRASKAQPAASASHPASSRPRHDLDGDLCNISKDLFDLSAPSCKPSDIQTSPRVDFRPRAQQDQKAPAASSAPRPKSRRAPSGLLRHVSEGIKTTGAPSHKSHGTQMHSHADFRSVAPTTQELSRESLKARSVSHREPSGKLRNVSTGVHMLSAHPRLSCSIQTSSHVELRSQAPGIGTFGTVSSPAPCASRSCDAALPDNELSGLEQARTKSLAPVDVRGLFTTSVLRAAAPATVSPPAHSKLHGSSSGELCPVSRINTKPGAASRACQVSSVRSLAKISTLPHSIEHVASPSSRMVPPSSAVPFRCLDDRLECLGRVSARALSLNSGRGAITLEGLNRRAAYSLASRGPAVSGSQSRAPPDLLARSPGAPETRIAHSEVTSPRESSSASAPPPRAPSPRIQSAPPMQYPIAPCSVIYSTVDHRPSLSSGKT
ncbi:hypothetical protein FISHEDRAFT_74739 [Fistulina hepatica ATCC 64428]|uniref:Uncharacterized protein n=1 Tax=Fistulina hepatica ATCC 64428 TaxID=1128425 RepID=A0A0D7A986_9AGAR|nr:hypothetical protein FISHEDRAFT_74739 [Fistulina hepatica ATCC 64428]